VQLTAVLQLLFVCRINCFYRLLRIILDSQRPTEWDRGSLAPDLPRGNAVMHFLAYEYPLLRSAQKTE
jgi:hypothetical protein